MNIALRKFLVLFLALLQLVAPLVHAHTDHDPSPDGIHLPGLEFTYGEQQPLQVQSVNNLADMHGIIIGVSSGIKQKNPLTDLADFFLICRQAPVYKVSLVSKFIDFFPSPAPETSHSITRPNAQRAPPLA